MCIQQCRGTIFCSRSLLLRSSSLSSVASSRVIRVWQTALRSHYSQIGRRQCYLEYGGYLMCVLGWQLSSPLVKIQSRGLLCIYVAVIQVDSGKLFEHCTVCVQQWPSGPVQHKVWPSVAHSVAQCSTHRGPVQHKVWPSVAHSVAQSVAHSVASAACAIGLVRPWELLTPDTILLLMLTLLRSLSCMRYFYLKLNTHPDTNFTNSNTNYAPQYQIHVPQ